MSIPQLLLGIWCGIVFSLWIASSVRPPLIPWFLLSSSALVLHEAYSTRLLPPPNNVAQAIMFSLSAMLIVLAIWMLLEKHE